MARRPTIADKDLITRLTQVFRDLGYEGASSYYKVVSCYHAAWEQLGHLKTA